MDLRSRQKQVESDMPSGELEFQRIARQAREFRERERKRIAEEKEEEAKRIAAKKAAERKKIARRSIEFLELEQGLVKSKSEDSEDEALLPPTSSVKLRAQWLRGLEKDAAKRRKLEVEFNTMYTARRKANPNETKEECEEAVKLALSPREDSQRPRNTSRHSFSLDLAIKENEKPKVLKILPTVSDTETEFESKEDERDDTNEANESESNNVITNKESSSEDEPGKIPVVKEIPSLDSALVESEEKLSAKEDTMFVETKEEEPEHKIEEEDGLDYGVEVDPRTQAMMSEDDIIRTGNTGDDFPDSSLNPASDGNKKNLVLENSIPVDKKSLKRLKGSSQSDTDDDESSSREVVYKEAMFELPVEVSKDGLIISPNTAELSMVTTIPPSRLGGKVSGRMEGRSTFSEISNTASGSASLEYKSSRHSRLTLGMIRGCEPYHPLITIGGQLLRHGSTVGVKFYHNAKFLHQIALEHSLWSLSFSHSFRNSKWLFSSELSRRKELALSLRNGNKLSGLVGWNLMKPEKFQARVDAHPKITAYRRAHVYCHWQALTGPGFWNFGVSLIQNLHSQIATVGLGWRLFSTRGLEWVISWSRGNSTIRIPIVVSKELSANSTIGHSLYVSVASFLIQEYIAEVWGWNSEERDGGIAERNRLLAIRAESLTKARKDADIQKELMSRQARRKVRDEKEQNGLVITKAIYQIEGVEEWDVTIPLQFWVSRSTLVLTAGPKSQLLGFYDIAGSLKNTRAIAAANDVDQTEQQGRKIPSLRDIVYDLLDWKPSDKSSKGGDSPSPTLTVWYEFKGQSYEVTVKDREELRLPAV